MVDIKQAVDILAVRRNGLWTLQIFTPENRKPKEVIVTRNWLDGCRLIEEWLDKDEENGTR